ncbi:conserved hypothetical protein [Trichinella spiralis]|uniref:hypothetical protein n=1 Tax=Trichinella spiralis TaxID=6334 RepID=UPI0001EFE9DD|nr:conserved hypothetical protein [Trichinella spiralis]
MTRFCYRRSKTGLHQFSPALHETEEMEVKQIAVEVSDFSPKCDFEDDDRHPVEEPQSENQHSIEFIELSGSDTLENAMKLKTSDIIESDAPVDLLVCLLPMRKLDTDTLITLIRLLCAQRRFSICDPRLTKLPDTFEKKSKKRSKSKKIKKTVADTVDKEAASSQMPETDIPSPKLTLASEVTAKDVDQANIVPPISEEKVEKPVTEAEPKVEKKDSKKIKKKSKKRSKSKKIKKTVEDTVADQAASSQMPETDITSPKLTLASEVTAIDVDQPNIVPPISEEKVEKPVSQQVENKDSIKDNKRTKKRSKSKIII